MKKLIIFFVSIIFITGCSVDNTLKEANDNETVNIEEKKEELVEYYKDNEMINKYLNIFNELYKDNQITSDMLSVYHHHGSDHKDQVQFYLKDKKITLTGGTIFNTISIHIDNDSTDDNVLKELTIMFTKALDSSLSENQITEYWDLQKQANGSINDYGNIEFWTEKNHTTNVFLYIKISGEIE